MQTRKRSNILLQNQFRFRVRHTPLYLPFETTYKVDSLQFEIIYLLYLYIIE